MHRTGGSVVCVNLLPVLSVSSVVVLDQTRPCRRQLAAPSRPVGLICSLVVIMVEGGTASFRSALCPPLVWNVGFCIQSTHHYESADM